MIASLFSVLALSSLARAACPLEGPWLQAASNSDYYTVTAPPNGQGSYRISCDYIPAAEGVPCVSWQLATLTPQGDTLSVTFDNGVQDTGKVLSDCSALQWAKGGLWIRAAVSQTPLCTAAGRWTLRVLTYTEEYYVAPSGVTAQRYFPDKHHAAADTLQRSEAVDTYTITCLSGPCTAWKRATLKTEFKELRGINGTVQFDNGKTDFGQISRDCEYLDWLNGSRWKRVATDVVLHIVPHSHNDPGWLDTLEVLYQDKVKIVYDQVVKALSENPNRTFAAEIGVFWTMWWKEQDAKTQEKVRKLFYSDDSVAPRMEWAGGGYVQPDEAVSHHSDLIDQWTLGHQWAMAHTGATPKVGWQADPFGHSSSVAYMFSLMEMEAFIPGRPTSNGDPINIESGVMWYPVKSQPDVSLWTHLHPGYWQPYRSIHEWLLLGDVTRATAILQDWLWNVHRPPFTKNVLIMMGDDWGYRDGDKTFPVLDKVIASINQSPRNIKAFYSTPSRFIKELAKEKIEWPKRGSEDLLPHQGQEMEWWTGFYASRPQYKQLFRRGSSLLRAASRFIATTSTTSTTSTLGVSSAVQADAISALTGLWQVVGLVQHHDAITCDSTQPVMDDFASKMTDAMKAVSTVLSTMVQVRQGSRAPPTPCTTALDAGSYACPGFNSSTDSSWVLTAYSSLAWPRDTSITLALPFRCTPATCTVQDMRSGAALPVQVIAVTTSSTELTFVAPALPPVGYANFLVKRSSSSSSSSSEQDKDDNNGDVSSTENEIILENEYLKLTFSSTGELMNVVQKEGAKWSSNTSMQVQFYSSNKGQENGWTFSTNGARRPAKFPGAGGPLQKVLRKIINTDSPAHFQELLVQIDPDSGITLRYRLFKGARSVELTATLGPFASSLATHNVDAVLRINSEIKNNALFYTDANGLEMKQRKTDNRFWASTYYDPSDPVACNFYPVTAGAILTEEKGSRSLVVVTEHPHGVTSLEEGGLEITLNRLWLTDEPGLMPRNVAVSVRLALFFPATPQQAGDYLRQNALAFEHPPHLFLLPQAQTQPGRNAPAEYKPILDNAIPPSVDILTLFPSFDSFSFLDPTTPAPPKTAKNVTSLVLRLQHTYADGEGSAKTVNVNLQNIFSSVYVWSAQEGDLTFIRGDRTKQQEQQEPVDFNVSLDPLDIRSLYLQVQ